MDSNQPELERLMVIKYILMTAEGGYLKNPTDSDNLTRWGGALVERSQYGYLNEAWKMLKEAVSKLEEALTINPANHEALWCLGNAHIYCGYITSDNGEAKLLFDEAFQCFLKAVNESPGNEIYLRSLADCAKAPALRRGIHGGPAATSNAKDSANLKYDMCGWVILAFGFLTWIRLRK